jgi:tetratricopeptide (TPR) repeat protein
MKKRKANSSGRWRSIPIFISPSCIWGISIFAWDATQRFLDDAIAEYERLLGINPNYPLAHYHLAQAFERKGEGEQALSHYKHFLEIWTFLKCLPLLNLC